MATGTEYGCSVDELKLLMELRGAEACEKIKVDYGSVEGLCARLRTDPANGIPQNNEELERRKAVFGANEIPPQPPKSFLQLVWEALQVSIIKFVKLYIEGLFFKFQITLLFFKKISSFIPN
jgi:hypothetical protein